MDVNSVETTAAPTEPVIVVDDASETLSENDIQAGPKEEVVSERSAIMTENNSGSRRIFFLPTG